MASPDAELPPIPEEELGRLIRILGMLGSSSAGERAAAALKASEWVRAHQTDWQTLLLPPIDNPVVAVVVAGDEPPPPTPPPPKAPVGQCASWQAAATNILQFYPAVLKGPKEEDFVKSLLLRGWPKLTDKQADWLRDICGRAGLSW